MFRLWWRRKWWRMKVPEMWGQRSRFLTKMVMGECHFHCHFLPRRWCVSNIFIHTFTFLLRGWRVSVIFIFTFYPDGDEWVTFSFTLSLLAKMVKGECHFHFHFCFSTFNQDGDECRWASFWTIPQNWAARVAIINKPFQFLKSCFKICQSMLICSASYLVRSWRL